MQIDVLCRCGTLTLGDCRGALGPLVLGFVCIAGAAFGAHRPTFVWQVQHFVQMWLVFNLLQLTIFRTYGLVTLQLNETK